MGGGSGTGWKKKCTKKLLLSSAKLAFSSQTKTFEDLRLIREFESPISKQHVLKNDLMIEGQSDHVLIRSILRKMCQNWLELLLHMRIIRSAARLPVPCFEPILQF